MDSPPRDRSTARSSVHALGMVDAMVRVCHLWVHHLEPDTSRWGESAHLAFVGGLIGGLCRHLNQAEGTERWAAYAYALLAGHGRDSLSFAYRVLAAEHDPTTRPDFDRGFREAGSLVTMINLPLEIR